MANRGRKFGSDPRDYEALRVDGADLYWNDKKLSTAGWTRAERITVTGIAIAAIVALLTSFLGNYDKWRFVGCSMHDFVFCPTLQSDPPPNATRHGSHDGLAAPAGGP